MTRKAARLKSSERHEVTRLCDKIVEIASRVNNYEELIVLESVFVQLTRHIDADSRKLIYDSVEAIFTAKDYVDQRHILPPNIKELVERDKGLVQIGLIAQNVTDTIFENAKKYKIDKNIIDKIIKTTLVRLALELNHESLREVADLLLPNIIKDKQTEEMRNMYG